MIALKITELKNFMGKLLGSDCFDSFLLEEASITTAATITIDGHVCRDFYTTEEWNDTSVHPYEFVTWKSMQKLCFEIIKGKKTPARFQIVFHLVPDYIPDVLKLADPQLQDKQVKALVLTCRYDGRSLMLITGTAFHSFVMDKTLDAAWDKTMRQFLAKKGIAFTEN